MSQSMLSPEFLLGAWQLTCFSVEFSDSRQTVYPFGEKAGGLLVYSNYSGSRGKVSAVLSRTDRIGEFALEQAHRASDEQKAKAFDQYMSYCGDFWIEGDQVVHSVSMALNPGTVGQIQKRKVQIESEDRIQLSYDKAAPSGIVRFFNLGWKRV